VPKFIIGGQYTSLVSACVHLEHVASANLDDNYDISSQRNSLCGKINNVLCNFWKRDLLLKLTLLRSYCSNFYGCVLWDMSNLAVEDVCIAWRKGLRLVWIFLFLLSLMLD